MRPLSRRRTYGATRTALPAGWTPQADECLDALTDKLADGFGAVRGRAD